MLSRRWKLPIGIMLGSLLVFACGDDDSPTAPTSTEIVGTWTSTEDGEVFSTDIRSDGTYAITVDGFEFESGTWSLSGSQLTFIDIEDGTEVDTCVYTVSISGNTLTTSYSSGAGLNECGDGDTATKAAG